MFETLGSYSWQTVHMSTQNGSHLEIWWNRILIHALELKLRPFKVFPYVCIGKPCVCNVFRPRATWKTGNTHGVRYLEIFSKLEYTLFACFVWLYCACIVVFLTIFLLSDYTRSRTKKKFMEELGALGDVIFIRAWVKIRNLMVRN